LRHLARFPSARIDEITMGELRCFPKARTFERFASSHVEAADCIRKGDWRRYPKNHDMSPRENKIAGSTPR